MSKRNAYHPSARLDTGSSATATAERKKRIPCTWNTQGFSCVCEVCADRLTSRQLDLQAAAATRALRGRI